MDDSNTPEAIPNELLNSILRDLRGGRDAQGALIAIVSALVTASQKGSDMGAELTLFPDAHFVGQSKYSKMQDAYLVVGKELGLPVEKRRHPGGSSYYAVLDHQRLRVTLAHLQKYKHAPSLRPFRLSTPLAKFRPWQLSLLNPLTLPPSKQLVAAIVYGYEVYDRATPSFMEIRFIDVERRAVMGEPIDLLKMLQEARVPTTEPIGERRKPRLRRQRKRGDASA